MNIEEAKKLMEDTKRDSTAQNRIFRGLVILSKYVSQVEIAAEHDQLFACDFEKTVVQMLPSEVAEMAALGWFEDEDAWAHFT